MVKEKELVRLKALTLVYYLRGLLVKAKKSSSILCFSSSVSLCGLGLVKVSPFVTRPVEAGCING